MSENWLINATATVIATFGENADLTLDRHNGTVVLRVSRDGELLAEATGNTVSEALEALWQTRPSRLLITTAQAAVRLGVSENRVRQFIMRGWIPARRVGRQNLIDPQDIEEFEKQPRGPGKWRSRPVQNSPRYLAQQIGVSIDWVFKHLIRTKRIKAEKIGAGKLWYIGDDEMERAIRDYGDPEKRLILDRDEG